jgi:hypothetical protein
VSGLKGKTVGDEERQEESDMTTLEERRHQLDMVQPFNIIRGHDAVANDNGLSMAQ